MDFQLTDEQLFVQKTVRRFAEAEAKPLAAQVDANHSFPYETVEKMGKMGLMGMTIPKEYGGAGSDFLSYYLVIEELAKACATTAVIVAAHSSLVAWPILTFGKEEQKAKYLPDMASGKRLGAFALTEPNAGTDSAKQETRADLDGDYYVLNGIKTFITNGGPADVFVVLAMTDRSKKNKGISAFIVERSDEGFFIGKDERKMGVCGSSTVNLTFKNCRIPKDRLLGEEGKGFKIAMMSLDGGRIGIAMQALGIAEAAFDEALNYIHNRKQFGGPLSRMQHLQFEMASLRTEIEAARGLIYMAIDRKERGLPYSEYSSMCKLKASETAMKVTTKAVQFMGGYGYSKDYPVERMMRDAKVTEIYEGTSEVQKLVIASKFI